MKKKLCKKANELIAMLNACGDEELVNDVIAAVSYAEPFNLED